MFNSSVLDVAIGVIFGFLAVSLITSAVVEAINSMLQTRSKTLLAGIQSLMNDPDFTGLARELYMHAAVNPRGPGGWPDTDAAIILKNKPAYVDPMQFAAALLDVTGLSAASAAQAPGTQTIQGLKDLITAKFVPAADAAVEGNPQVKQLLDGIIQRADGDMQAMQKEIATWFDGAMDRVSGVFKRRTQILSFGIALLIAILFNVDTFRVASLIWAQPTIAGQLEAPAALPSGAAMTPRAMEDVAKNVIQALDTQLPAGWTPARLNAFDFWQSAPGWLVTALATLFGAPFWFDMLQSFVRLKGAGPSPAEKKSGAAAAA